MAEEFRARGLGKVKVGANGIDRGTLQAFACLGMLLCKSVCVTVNERVTFVCLYL